jgi:hypothetical protein
MTNQIAPLQDAATNCSHQDLLLSKSLLKFLAVSFPPVHVEAIDEDFDNDNVIALDARAGLPVPFGGRPRIGCYPAIAFIKFPANLVQGFLAEEAAPLVPSRYQQLNEACPGITGINLHG